MNSKLRRRGNQARRLQIKISINNKDIVSQIFSKPGAKRYISINNKDIVSQIFKSDSLNPGPGSVIAETSVDSDPTEEVMTYDLLARR